MNINEDAVTAPFVRESSLLDSDWNASKPVRIKCYWSGDPAPATRHAEVRLCWSEAGLHLRFQCEQHEPLVITESPVTKVKTIGLWDRDVCEVFLAPDTQNGNRYFEFEAAPTGEWIDLRIQITPAGKETDWDYSSGMKVSAETGGEKVLVFITIPWSADLPKPSAGDTWGINLFRCVGTEEATRYLAWRPTRTPEPNFHVPSAFGVLRFG